MVTCPPMLGKQDLCGLNDDLILPPPAYDYPYPGTLIEITAYDMTDMARLCHPNPFAAKALGCAQRRFHPITGGDHLLCTSRPPIF